jgi:hypothetical protein
MLLEKKYSLSPRIKPRKDAEDIHHALEEPVRACTKLPSWVKIAMLARMQCNNNSSFPPF